MVAANSEITASIEMISPPGLAIVVVLCSRIEHVPHLGMGTGARITRYTFTVVSEDSTTYSSFVKRGNYGNNAVWQLQKRTRRRTRWLACRLVPATKTRKKT